MENEHKLWWRDPDGKHAFEGFKKLDISSRDFNTIAQEQFKSWNYPDMQLASVYRRIADYSDKFFLFTKTTRDIVYLPHEKFIGKPYEAPVPLVQMLSSSNSEHYFYPKDRKFMGRFGRQFEILDLAMPYISIMLWEQSGYFSYKEGRSKLHLEIELDFDAWLTINPEFVDKYPKLTRPEILLNLEFLLGFIPRERPIILDQCTDVVPRKRARK